MKVSSVIRKFTVLLALSTLALTVMNCSKKDDPSPQAQIVGTWKISNLFIKQGNNPETDIYAFAVLTDDCITKLSITFKSDGNITAAVPNECKDTAEDYLPGVEQGKFEVKDNNLLLTSSGSTESIPLSFEGGKMFWTLTDGSDSIRIGFTKQ